ncbi:MAG: hypothetical protein GXO92_04905 [FCB group bacterium]|nr:hypothetical protein [FCB group bacterium]
MVKRLFLLVLISIAWGSDKAVLFPFDWAGQYGVMSVNGQLIWNQDWRSGPLLFDGTFTYYPLRLGPAYYRNYTAVAPSDVAVFGDLPDTTLLTSNFDYRKGDYLYDQLEVNADFGDKNRLIGWSGFKRTYAGMYNQYAQPSSYLTPLQQSYRIDYRSRQNNDMIDVSVAHFVTNSGLPDSSTNGLLRDRITVAGVHYEHRFKKWNWIIDGSQFNQKYGVNLSSLPDFPTRYLTRGYIHSRLTYPQSDSASIFFGLAYNQQSLLSRLISLKARNWSHLYGGLRNKDLLVHAGLTLAAVNDFWPYLRIRFVSLKERRELIIKFQMEARPVHLMKWVSSSKTFLEKWYVGGVDYQRNMGSLKVGGELQITWVDGFENLFRYGMPETATEYFPRVIAGKIKSTWSLTPDLRLKGYFQRTNSLSSLSDGTGKRLHFEIYGRTLLFKNNMNTIIQLAVDGLWDRLSHFGFDPYLGIPYVNGDPGRSLPDYWVGHFQLTAEISSVTLVWSVKNILNSSGVFFQKIAPGIPEEYYWIKNSDRFPPIGNLVNFQIIWNFRN